MNPVLEVFLNGRLMIEYPRNTRLPGKQREFLDIIDIDMDKGIELDGKIIESPDSKQRQNLPIQRFGLSAVSPAISLILIRIQTYPETWVDGGIMR